ncbi:MAG: SMC family ATPase [Erysipelotrichaceae bacterium]|nr:SMC family ATPase [Erysipelotrichaceae bacterium]
MRPLLLTMQAFGPYANQVEVDFTKLRESGIYLISGDTGAGKTTIFDGICYALFDKTSGSQRTAEQLRSMYAEAGVNTEVELTFLYDGKEYRVKRSPKYEYVNRNGNTSSKAAVAELVYPDGKVLTMKSQVDKAIEEILHLDYEQFRRIVMLAQGDFTRMLFDKDGRGAILREIFGTSFYQDIRYRIYEDYKKAIEELKSSKDRIRQYLKMTSYEENTAENEQLKLLKENEDALTKDICRLLESINAKDEESLGKIKEEIVKQDDILSSLSSKIALAQKAQNEAEEYEKGKAELPKVTEAFKAATEEAEAMQKRQPEVEGYVAEITKLQAEEPKYQQAEEAEKELNTLKSSLTSSKQQLESQTGRLRAIHDEILSLKEKQETYKDLSEKEKDASVSYQIAQGEVKALEQLLGDWKQRKADLIAFNNAKNAYLTVRQTAEGKQREYNEDYQNFLDSQAGILAEELKDGEPCPVCGSLQHPSLAKRKEGVKSEAELKAEKADLDRVLEDLQSKSALASGKKAAYENSNQRFENNYVTVMKAEASEDAEERITNALREKMKEQKELEEALRLILTKKKEKEEVEKPLPQKETLEKQLEESTGKLREAIASADASITAKEAQWKQLKEQLHFYSVTDLKIDIRRVSMLRDQLRNAIEASVVKKNQTALALRELQSKLSTLEASLKKAPQLNLADLLKEKEAEDAARESSRKMQMRILSRHSTNTDALKGIQKIDADVAELEEKGRYLKALSDTCSGKLSGKDKIDFETYVQMTYFDRILVYANRRLEIMSDNQYSFERAEGGLELNVIDHYNGSLRSVKTLSGGESFKASLSLALGLSDEVMSRTSSVHIDTMFVDEGFGSLDEESLSKAMEALSMLSDGSRQVGIISHVKELQERIDQQIIVRKDADGLSHIEWVL